MSDADYLIRMRKGKPILVHKQIVAWRKKNRKKAKALKESEPKPDPTKIKFFE